MKANQIIGSISSGTMREEDLIPAFMSVLEDLNPDKAKELREQNPDVFEWLDGDCPDEVGCPEDTDWLLETLCDALNDCAPPYFYFGSHPGDGADYGFWLDEDFQQKFKDDGGLIVSDLSEVPEHPDCAEVLLVNDHGNMTLYAVDGDKLNEVWSIV